MRYAAWAVALTLSSVAAVAPARADRGRAAVAVGHPPFSHPFFFHPAHPFFFQPFHPFFFRSTVFFGAPGFAPPPFAYYPPPPAYAYAAAPAYYYPPPPPAAAPAPNRSNGAADCRDYQTTITIDGKPQPLVGTVCKGPDGNWHVVP
ncbi:MAG TPA: hypothetical protein VMA53_02195 [Stellaceae bacterium]|nr:hypothetical protein [Stellaceae bacterium]